MHGCRFGNFAAELSTRDPQLCAKVAGVFAEMRTYFAAAIADAVRAGDVAPVDVGDAALGLLAHMEGLLLVAKTANDPTPIRRFASDARALLGAGPATVPATDRTDSTRSTVR
jgi:TetR/AcrR family transcriptional repressor of nem operon